MVEVYKTDVHDRDTAQRLIAMLLERYPNAKINFDLDDCDRVLRVEDRHIMSSEIGACLNRQGFLCEELE